MSRSAKLRPRRRAGWRGGWLLIVCCVLLAGCGAAARTSQTSTPSQPNQPQQVLFPQPTSTYVAIGASDAFGVGTDDPARQCWPSVLAGQLGSSPHLINLGIPGATTDQAIRDELPIALEAKPNLVTVLLGTNDVIEDVPVATSMRNMQALLFALRLQTNATVYVGNLPDLTLLPYFAHEDRVDLRLRIAQFNDQLADVVASEGAVLVDLHGQWTDLATHPEYISPDGLHPSTAGAARIAQLFAAQIASQKQQQQQQGA